MHISLTPELENKIKSKVESGMYNNASEVVREALRLMDKYEGVLYQFKMENLRNALIEAEESGFSKNTVDDIIADCEGQKYGV